MPPPQPSPGRRSSNLSHCPTLPCPALRPISPTASACQLYADRSARDGYLRPCNPCRAAWGEVHSVHGPLIPGAPQPPFSSSVGPSLTIPWPDPKLCVPSMHSHANWPLQKDKALGHPSGRLAVPAECTRGVEAQDHLKSTAFLARDTVRPRVSSSLMSRCSPEAAQATGAS